MRFREIQAHWYERLRAEGFEDIEVRGGDGHSYRSIGAGRPDLRPGRGYSTEINREAHVEFYRRAGHFLHGYRFKSDSDRLVWHFFCEGEPYRDIGIKVGKSAATVCRMVKRILDGPFKDFLQARLSTDLYDYEEDEA